MDVQIFILPFFLKRQTAYSIQIRRMDIDGCPIYTLCEVTGGSEWIETSWASFGNFAYEFPACCYAYFDTQEAAQQAANDFIKTFES